MYLTNFIFTRTFSLTASYKIFKNGAILIKHESFFKEINSPQFDRF